MSEQYSSRVLLATFTVEAEAVDFHLRFFPRRCGEWRCVGHDAAGSVCEVWRCCCCCCLLALTY